MTTKKDAANKKKLKDEITKKMLEEATHNVQDLMVDKKEEMIKSIQHHLDNDTKDVLTYPVLLDMFSGRTIYNRTALSAVEVWVGFRAYKDVVNQIISEVDDEFVPTVKQFCHFLGISTSTYQSYLRSNDEEMRMVVEQAEDYFTDIQVTLAQKGVIRDRPTVFNLKSTHNMIEATQQQERQVTTGISINEIEKSMKNILETSEKGTKNDKRKTKTKAKPKGK